MKLVVCLKRVPDSTTNIKIGADGKAIDPQGVEFKINPYDELAIEAALRLKEKHGGEAVGVCIDPAADEVYMRKVIAIGLDSGVLIKSDTGFDGAATAKILADVLKDMEFDIAFFGKQAIDDDSLQVPTYVAHRLGLPRVTVCTKVEPQGDPPTSVKVAREIEGGEERLELSLPCVVAVQKGVNDVHEPRYATLKGIMAAKKKPLEKKEIAAGDAVQEIVKMELPPERPPGKIVGEGVEAVPELVRLLREEAKVI